MRFVIRLLTNAAAIAAAAWLVGGISFEGADWQENIGPLLVVALIMAVVSMSVKPLVQLISIPFIILTIGLFLFVINALMLMLTSWIAGLFDVGFHVDGFWAALWGSIIITLVTFVIDLLLFQDDR